MEEQTTKTRGDEMLAVLVAHDEDVAPQEFALTEAECFLGRASDCQVVIKRMIISRQHARIAYDAGDKQFVLHDLGSANGTYVNGKRIHAAHVLAHGDAIGFSLPTPLVSFQDGQRTHLVLPKLRFDEKRWEFIYKDEKVDLTADQFDLLHHLWENAGDSCDREGCSQAVWHRAYDATMDADALDQIVSRVRARLKKIDPAGVELITTQRGRGYRLEVW